MADFTALKNSIRNYIKQNGNAEITGEILQNILLSMVVSMGDGAINGVAEGLTNEATARSNADASLQNAINSISTALGDGYTYAGIATPATTPASGRIFYLALQAGTYTNFNGIVVTQGINILKNNNGTWQLDNVIGIDDVPTVGSPKLVKSGGVAEVLNQLKQETLSTKADAESIENIFDKTSMADRVLGYFIGNGDWGVDAESAISSKIPIKGNTNYVYHCFQNAGSFYAIICDENNTTLTPLNQDGTQLGRMYVVPGDKFRTPNEANHIRVTTTLSGRSVKNDISIYEGTEERGYLPYTKKLLYNELPLKLFEDLSYKANLETVVVSRNLFNKSAIKQGWIETSDGNLIEDGDNEQQVSDPIQIQPNAIYYITFDESLSSKALRFLDGNGLQLKALNPTNDTELNWNIGQSCAIKAPSTAEFVQFQVLINGSGNVNTVQFELGEYPTPYQEYQEERLLPEEELPLSVKDLIGENTERTNVLSLNLSAGSLSAIETPFDANSNLKMYFYFNSIVDNKNFNWDRYTFVNKITGVETLAKNADDDICPELLGFGGDMGYIGGNHGADGLFRLTCIGHDKTYADIGSIWSNGEYYFTIVKIEENYIYVRSNNIENYPNWSISAPTVSADFNHVSGASHTTAFSISDVYRTQWWPIVVIKSRRIYADGKELLKSGKYNVKEVMVTEDYDVLNPASVLEKIQEAVGTFTENPSPTDFAATADVVFSHAIVYTFKSAAINFISTNVIYKQAVNFDHFGFAQSIELPADEGLKLYIPKAKSKNNGLDAVDFRTIVNASQGTGTIMQNDFEVPALPPDRQLHFNPHAALMLGYLFDYGVGGHNRAAALADHRAIYQSTAGLKMYPYGISANTIHEYSHYSAVCFKTFLDRNFIDTNGVISKNVFEYNGRCYIYGDFNASGVYEIPIPEKFIGHKVNVFEVRENVTLLTEFATDRIKIKVNTADVMYGYIVAYID